jgi:hypothetical protein
VGLFPHGLLLLDFFLGLQSEVPNQAVDLATAFLLLILELAAEGLAMGEFPGDDFCQFLLFLLAGG